MEDITKSSLATPIPVKCPRKGCKLLVVQMLNEESFYSKLPYSRRPSHLKMDDTRTNRQTGLKAEECRNCGASNIDAASNRCPNCMEIQPPIPLYLSKSLTISRYLGAQLFTSSFTYNEVGKCSFFAQSNADQIDKKISEFPQEERESEMLKFKEVDVVKSQIHQGFHSLYIVDTDKISCCGKGIKPGVVLAMEHAYTFVDACYGLNIFSETKKLRCIPFHKLRAGGHTWQTVGAEKSFQLIDEYITGNPEKYGITREELTAPATPPSPAEATFTPSAATPTLVGAVPKKKKRTLLPNNKEWMMDYKNIKDEFKTIKKQDKKNEKNKLVSRSYEKDKRTNKRKSKIS